MNDLQRAAGWSAGLHLAVMVLAFFGLPQIWSPPPVEDRPLIVEALPLAAITNAPPPRPDPPRPEPPKEEPPKAEPPKPEPPKQVAQEAPKPEPPPPPQPPPPAPAPPPPTPPPPAPPPPAPAPTPTPPEPAPAPPPPAPRPPTPPPPAPPRPTPPAPQRTQQNFDIDNMLRDLQKARPQPAAPAPPQQTAQAPASRAASSNAPHNPLQPLSMTEEDAIRQRVIRNWNVDVGAKGIETFFVELRVFVGLDGQVQDVRIERTSGTPAEPLRAFAEGARRATLRSSPLPLPPGRGAQLTGGNLILTFTAKEMLGIRG